MSPTTANPPQLSALSSRVIAPYLAAPEVEPLITESGLPDPGTFPTEELAMHLSDVLRSDADSLQYGTFVDGELFHGSLALRTVLARRSPGRVIDARSVLVTCGAAQAIALAALAVVDPGDVVAVETPSWDFMLHDLREVGADVERVSLDDEGPSVDDIVAVADRAASDGRRLKLLYTIPTFNVPTGRTTTEARRRQLLDLAAERGFWILEDDVYGALRYSGSAVPTLFELDTHGVVIRVDSFSKTISPALRTGWALAAPEVIAAMARLRRDLGSSHLVSRALARYVDSGEYDVHVQGVREVYRRKRDLVVEEIEQRCAPLIECTAPEGGYFLWLRVSDEVDVAELHRRAAAGGVICRPGDRFEDGPRSSQHLRLSFTEADEPTLRQAVAVLAEAAHASLADPSRRAK